MPKGKGEGKGFDPGSVLGSGADIRRRVARVVQRAREVAPDPPSPEETRREAEEFLDKWAADVAKEARGAWERRQRGEPLPRPPEHMSGVQIMGEAASYGGREPPETVRRPCGG